MLYKLFCSEQKLPSGKVTLMWKRPQCLLVRMFAEVTHWIQWTVGKEMQPNLVIISGKCDFTIVITRKHCTCLLKIILKNITVCGYVVGLWHITTESLKKKIRQVIQDFPPGCTLANANESIHLQELRKKDHIWQVMGRSLPCLLPACDCVWSILLPHLGNRDAALQFYLSFDFTDSTN